MESERRVLGLQEPRLFELAAAWPVTVDSRHYAHSAGQQNIWPKLRSFFDLHTHEFKVLLTTTTMIFATELLTKRPLAGMHDTALKQIYDKETEFFRNT